MRYQADRDGFLHPVLGQREHNWPGGSFTASVDMSLTDTVSRTASVGSHTKVLLVDAKFNLTVEAIKRLIIKGDAVCAVWIYCSKTSYRELLQTHTATGDEHAANGQANTNNGHEHERNRQEHHFRVRGSIPTSLLRGVVEVHPLVLTRVDTHLDVSEAHQAYQDACQFHATRQPTHQDTHTTAGATHHNTTAGVAHVAHKDTTAQQPMYPISAGSPLAVHPRVQTRVVDSDLTVRSMFRFKQIDETDPLPIGWHVEADTESVFVDLRAKQETFQMFNRARYQNPLTAEQSLYLAALTEALMEWLHARSANDGDWKENGWCATIDARLEEHGITVTDENTGKAAFYINKLDRAVSPTWVAQLLLRYPLNRFADDNQLADSGLQ